MGDYCNNQSNQRLIMSLSIEDFEITFDLPKLKVQGLKPYQVRAANYLLSARQAINGMGRGLGKGVVILAALDAKDLFPAIYVAPANTKLKVAAEVLHWLEKRRSVSIIAGRKQKEAKPKQSVEDTDAVNNPVQQSAEEADAYNAMHSTEEVEAQVLQLEEEIPETKFYSVKLKDGSKAEIPINDLTADVLIVNYQIAYSWAETLITVKHKALVIDEAHRILDQTSSFYKACLFMSRHTQRVKGHQHIFPMTGNFVVNHNRDLMPLIHTMNRLHEFGGRRKFLERYCDLHEETIRVQGKDRVILNDKGSSNTKELFHHLRARCLFRTTMREEFPEETVKKRVPITIPLANRIEYDKARRNIIQYVRQEVLGNYDFYQELSIMELPDLLKRLPAEYKSLIMHYSEDSQALMCRNYLRENGAKSRAFRAMKAQTLAQRTKLRELTGIGKVPGIKSWIRQFQIENPEKKIVIFAVHQKVQKALIKALPNCAKLIGGQKLQERSNEIERFDQDKNCKEIVVSTGAGSEGSDFDIAEDVLHAELPYTSLALEQSEDRVCRVRNLHGVNSWISIAPDSTDNVLLKIVQRKFDLALQIQDGIEAEALLSEPLEDSILEYMIAAAMRGE